MTCVGTQFPVKTRDSSTQTLSFDNVQFENISEPSSPSALVRNDVFLPGVKIQFYFVCQAIKEY